MRLRAAAVAVAVAGLAAPSGAQFSRYELGRRLRQFEQDWEVADAPGRARAAPAMDRAVKAFFGFNTERAALELAQARMALAGVGEIPWAASLACPLSARLITSGATLRVQVVSVIDVDADPPDRAVLALRLVRPDGVPGAVLTTVSLATLAEDDEPVAVELDLTGVVVGDHRLRAEVRAAGKVSGTIDQTISVVDDLDDRLAALAKSVGEARADTVDVASLRRLHSLLSRLAKGHAVETDLPAARLLAEAEDLARASAAGEPFFAAGPSGEHWLQLPVSGGNVPLRLWAPATDEVRPLVLLLHGAGGTENMFFDAYGAGLAVRLAKERGWFAVAPGSGFALGSRLDLVALVDNLSALYRIDRQRVFVVGHSMGAALAVTTTTAAPARFRAVATLGGGGGRLAERSAELVELPFFVATGELDFARRSVASLARRLRAYGVTVESRDYAGVEHLGVVQRALVEVFEFFDGHGL